MITNYWKVFDYEVNQFNVMCELLCAGNPAYALVSQEIRNAVVESALIHTRILVQIFLCEKLRDDFDITDLASEFTSTNTATLRSAYDDEINGSRARDIINKRLAHPSKIRGDSHDYSPLLEAIVPILRSLIAEIQPHRPSTSDADVVRN